VRRVSVGVFAKAAGEWWSVGCYELHLLVPSMRAWGRPSDATPLPIFSAHQLCRPIPTTPPSYLHPTTQQPNQTKPNPAKPKTSSQHKKPKQTNQNQAPHYLSDFTDGATIKGLAATFFLFFACLAPAVAFGGLMGKVTDGHVRLVVDWVVDWVVGLVGCCLVRCKAWIQDWWCNGVWCVGVGCGVGWPITHNASLGGHFSRPSRLVSPTSHCCSPHLPHPTPPHLNHPSPHFNL
jgi:hypothetical protein